MDLNFPVDRWLSISDKTLILETRVRKRSLTSERVKYSLAEVAKLGARMFEAFGRAGVRIPNRGIAIGVEQLVIRLNNAGKNVDRVAELNEVANLRNAAVKEVYLSEAEKWLTKNIPDWEKLFKIAK